MIIIVQFKIEALILNGYFVTFRVKLRTLLVIRHCFPMIPNLRFDDLIFSDLIFNKIYVMRS
ncbi:hypothetical protein GCM10007162_05680 [Ignatzschineria ureiclastica]|nr:hypothetical protein GCM10007162_05680 [Ignatzschineria ureiclastica]